eukprot:8462837-Alexandrium_andersonii.AAC.1
MPCSTSALERAAGSASAVFHVHAALPPPAAWQTLRSSFENITHVVPSVRQCSRHFSARKSSFICAP